MTYYLDKAYYDLGKVIFESGVAEAFGIEPDHQIDFNHEGVLMLIEFIQQYSDESITSYATQAANPASKIKSH